jgi:hypothetical protein
MPGGAFGARHFAAGFLALPDQFEDLAVEFGDPAAQVVERGHGVPCNVKFELAFIDCDAGLQGYAVGG